MDFPTTADPDIQIGTHEEDEDDPRVLRTGPVTARDLPAHYGNRKQRRRILANAKREWRRL